jgi:hypothetical protein
VDAEIELGSCPPPTTVEMVYCWVESTEAHRIVPKEIAISFLKRSSHSPPWFDGLKRLVDNREHAAGSGGIKPI